MCSVLPLPLSRRLPTTPFLVGATWRDERDTDRCSGRLCRRVFNFLVSKHHCRWCGGVYCDACAPRNGTYMGGIYRKCNACRLPPVFRSCVNPRTKRREAGPLHHILSFLSQRDCTALLQSCYTMMSEFPLEHYPYCGSIQERFPSFFEGAQIGKGGFGTVYKCEDRHSPHRPRVAIKCISKANIRTALQWVKTVMELEILSTINHVNVASLLEVFQTQHDLVIVMEAGDGGTLRQGLEYVRRHELPLEPFVASVVLQVSEGLSYLYQEQHIVHRDIKFENIVLSGDYSVAMIVDFGLAEYVRCEEGQVYSASGTPGYASPENVAAVVSGVPNFEATGLTMHKSDVFSLGVVAYMMLTLRKPLRSTAFVKQYEELQRGIYCTGPLWDGISACARDLVEQMLRTDIHQRATSDIVRSHPFITTMSLQMDELAAFRRHALEQDDQAERENWVLLDPCDSEEFGVVDDRAEPFPQPTVRQPFRWPFSPRLLLHGFMTSWKAAAT